MMHRNLDRRVEVLVRLVQEDHLREIDALFDLAMSPETSSWHLEPDETWVRHAHADDGTSLADMQDGLMRQISKRRRSTR
jgi:polyphosphate kinase